VRRAEAEGRRTLAEKKKAANKQRDLQILLAKQEQERAREREARRKEKQQKAMAKQSKLEELSSDVLESLVEKDRQQQEEAELMRAKKRARAKYIALDEEPAYVYKKGMRIQKLAAQVRSCLGFSLFRLFFA
jgi:hypothetical protein